MSRNRVYNRVNNRVNNRVWIFFLPQTKPDRGAGQDKDNPCPIGATKHTWITRPDCKIQPRLCSVHSPSLSWSGKINWMLQQPQGIQQTNNGIQLTLTTCPSSSGSVWSNVLYKLVPMTLWRLFKFKIKFHMNVISRNSNLASFHWLTHAASSIL